MSTLRDLIDNKNTDKDTAHSYLDTYEALLSSKKETATAIVEVGVQHGGSIKLWRDYFVNADIYGIDTNEIDRDCITELKKDSRVTLLIPNDGYSEKTVSLFTEKELQFDMIMDDGPHVIELMKQFITLYLPLLKPDGVMIIEDVCSIDWIPILKDSVPEEFKQYIQVFDLRHIKDRKDDILFVINKSLTV